MDVVLLPKQEQSMDLDASFSQQLNVSTESDGASLHCVGSLQVQRQLKLGFLCGSLPVPTDNDAMTCGISSSSDAAIVPAVSLQNERNIAPRYRMLPSQTDLNTLLLSDMEHEPVFSLSSGKPPAGLHELCKAWGNGYYTQPLARKCEALAVSGLAGHGDEIDIIAPVEILKKIFKIPYSKARLSVAVHRVGRTLILNTGPDVEESENLVRPKKNQAKAMERSLFLKFAMQSVRAEACDCPSSHSSEQQSSIPNQATPDPNNGYWDASIDQHLGWEFMANDVLKKSRASGSSKSLNAGRGGSQKDHNQRFWDSSRVKTGINSLDKSGMIGEQQRDHNFIPSEPGNHKRQANESFLRVLFWQLEELRMLLGSDLLRFSNEKHVAVSLHLWEIERVTPVMWLDAWLDNVMASVPELAICYHHNGIIQGYELLKTDDIFLLKGLSDDGTSFFHPHVVQQNALSVLRFLQENCKQDPGTYWLFKNSGEDLVQLFDLSVISKSCNSTTKAENKGESLPSPWGRGKGSCSLPLGVLLYRLAHKLSLSQDPSDRRKCANFFKKCLEFLGEQEHLFVRASAHEHVARLILRCHQELGSMLMPFLLDTNEHDGATPSQRALEHSGSVHESLDANDSQEKSPLMQDSPIHPADSVVETVDTFRRPDEVQAGETNASYVHLQKEITSTALAEHTSHGLTSLGNENNEATPIVQTSTDTGMGNKTAVPSPEIAKPVVGSVSVRLAAVHHVSQAITALRWQRQLQDVEDKVSMSESKLLPTSKYVQLVPVCVDGEIDCIEFCDIRECELSPFMDQKLWHLILLLGESYLALGQAYKDDRQLMRALKAAELACSVYDSMPQNWRVKGKDGSFDQMNQWIQVPRSHPASLDKGKPSDSRNKSASQSFCQPLHESDMGRYVDQSLFWGQAWILVGDIYVEYQEIIRKDKVSDDKENLKSDGPTMAQEVVKEVKRLRKKLGQGKKNCSVCSLLRCSCQSDRANSGNSASSSSSFGSPVRYPRKHGRKTSANSAEMISTSFAEGGHTSNCGNSDANENISTVSKNSKHFSTAAECHDDQDGQNCKSNTSMGPTAHALEHKPSDLEQSNKYIFTFLKGPTSTSTETNLQIAAECYDYAVVTLNEMWHGSEEIKSALRKKGWACNEVGRMRLAGGDMKAAEAVFEKAISAFKEVEDHTNIVLIYCNIAHGKRASAEALVSELDNLKGVKVFEHLSQKILEDAMAQYVEALKAYATANEARKLLNEVLSTAVELSNEVQTQYAHTYLRLGMLLAKEEKYGHQHLKASADNTHSDLRGSEKSKSPNLHQKISLTANDAIREAITLYESLGSLRAQEAAFAQFQLACYHRDFCLAIINTEVKRHSEMNHVQQAKRYLTLADRYWVKALKYYKPTTHPDMFLEILMQRSALHIACAPTFNQIMMMDVALSRLLEAREICVPVSVSSTGPPSSNLKLSDQVLTKFSQQLQTLLRTMLATVHKKGEPQRLVNGGDLMKLKEMYRLALKSANFPDLQGMYNLWTSAH